MRIVFALLFLIHGIAHGVGFVVPWRLADFEEMPYTTTLLAGRLEVGAVGIRLVGILWLLVGVAFLVVGVAAWTRQAWWPQLAGGLAIVSLMLCVLGWPESRIGLVVNLTILVLLLLGARYGWLPLLRADRM